MTSTASTEHDPWSVFPGGRAAVFARAAAMAAAWSKRAPGPTGRRPKRGVAVNQRGGIIVPGSARVYQTKAPVAVSRSAVGAKARP